MEEEGSARDRLCCCAPPKPASLQSGVCERTKMKKTRQAADVELWVQTTREARPGLAGQAGQAGKGEGTGKGRRPSEDPSFSDDVSDLCHVIPDVADSSRFSMPL